MAFIVSLLLPPVENPNWFAAALNIPVSASSLNVNAGPAATPFVGVILAPPVVCDENAAEVNVNLTVPPVENPRTFAPPEYIPVSESPPNEYSGEPASELILAWNILAVAVPLTSNFPAGLEVPMPTLPDGFITNL